MTEARDISFIVLTESDHQHHVAVRRRGSEWLQIIGSFHDRNRAESYAEIEETVLFDESFEDYKRLLAARPPVIASPPINSSRLIETIRESKVTREITRETNEPASVAQETKNHVSSVADEIFAVLPSLIEEFPKGPTSKIISTRLSIEEQHVRRAIKVIEDQGRGVVMRRKDSPAYHLIPVGYSPPLEELTPSQSAVLGIIGSRKDSDGLSRISFNELANLAVCSKGGLSAVIFALANKKRLEIIHKGCGTKKNIYRVIEVPR